MTILGLVNERSEVVKEYRHTRRMVMGYYEKQRRQGIQTSHLSQSQYEANKMVRRSDERLA